MLERYGHCAKHCSTCNNCANKPGFLRHNVLPLDCRTVERISSTGPAANDSGIERKRVLSAVCSRKNRQRLPQQLQQLGDVCRNPPCHIARQRLSRLGCATSPPNCSMNAWAVAKSEKHQR